MSKFKKKTRVAPKLKKKKISPSVISPVTLSLLFGVPLLAGLIAGGYHHTTTFRTPSSKSRSMRAKTLSSVDDIGHKYDKEEENKIIDALVRKNQLYAETIEKKNNEMRASVLQPKMTLEDREVSDHFKQCLDFFRTLYKDLADLPRGLWLRYTNDQKTQNIGIIASTFDKLALYAGLPSKLKEKEDDFFAYVWKNPTFMNIKSLIDECQQLDYGLTRIFFIKYGFYV